MITRIFTQNDRLCHSWLMCETATSWLRCEGVADRVYWINSSKPLVNPDKLKGIIKGSWLDGLIKINCRLLPLFMLEMRRGVKSKWPVHPILVQLDIRVLVLSSPSTAIEIPWMRSIPGGTVYWSQKYPRIRNILTLATTELFRTISVFSSQTWVDKQDELQLDGVMSTSCA